MNILLFAFLFFLPAGIANMAPVVTAKVPFLQKFTTPLDFGMQFRKKRLLGDHKTVRGLIAGVITGTLFAVCINSLFHLYKHPLIVGFLLSFGALLGDSVKSFFKRQMGVASGKSWFTFDQIDYIVGGLSLSLLAVRLQVLAYVTIFLLYFLLHLLVSFIGFLLHLKESAI